MTGRASAQSSPPTSPTNLNVNNAIPGSGDYRCLVCLFLAGGNDSFNMVVPRETTEFNNYRSARADLALAASDVIDISNPLNGKAYGIHNSMPELTNLYNSGDLAFLANVGTLLEPTTVADYENETAALPLGLFSHNDQQMHWQTSVPDQRSAIGWAGKAGEILQSLNEASDVGMNISLDGMNIMQQGNSTVPYSITTHGVTPIDGYNADWLPYIRPAIDSLLSQEYESMLKRTFADVTRRSIDAEQEFTAAIDAVPDFSVSFPDNHLANQLEMVARSIGARETLGMRRQTFFVSMGGYDLHDGVLDVHGPMLAEVDAAVKAFWDAIGELGIQNDVTLFSTSEFGRTLSSNGAGSDHAWGGNQFILGGAVQGGNIYGEYPEDLSLDGPLDVGRGRIVPTTSVDEYFADLVKWMGVSQSDLGTVLPNLNRFYDLSSSAAPVGIFG